jgi:hypothetical protein
MFEMDKCREEFEESRTFKYFYSVLMHFDEELNCYSSNNSLRVRDAELLTASWWAFQEQQAKVEGLQKRVDAIKQLIQDYLSEEKELELKEWEQSTIYGRIAIELEQALKGEV